MVFLSATLLFAIVSGIFFTVGKITAKKLPSQYAAERWGKNFSQISVFVESGNITTASIGAIRGSIIKALEENNVIESDDSSSKPSFSTKKTNDEDSEQDLNLEPQARSFIDSYSADFGIAQINGEYSRNYNCDITVADGDFFKIQGFRFLSGSPYTLSQWVVLDENLAWKIFGSTNVADMSVRINGKEFSVAGVIAAAESKYESPFAGDVLRAYISYASAEYLQNEPFSEVTQYDAVIPNPVESFAEGVVNNAFEAIKDNSIIIENTGRFNAWNRIIAYKNLAVDTIKTPDYMPWWELAARYLEYRLTYIFGLAFIFAIPPSIVMFAYFIALLLKIKKCSPMVKSAISKIFLKRKVKNYEQQI